jgi:hypothetical protein
MAIVFDPAAKIISLDTFSVSASEIWSRWVDWVVLEDNSKYPIAFSQLGGVAPVSLYLFLENGWKVRPQEADGQTTISGNLLVQGGGNPFVSTIGSFSSQVTIEAPLAAQAIEVNLGSGVTAQDKIDISSAVWDVQLSSITGAGTIGTHVRKGMLTIKKFIGLK